MSLEGLEIYERTLKSTCVYRVGALLGKGGFAKCYEVQGEDGVLFAAKVIEKSSLVKARSKQKLINEIRLHKSLDHPGIVRFKHNFEDENNVYLVLERCSKNTLKDLLKARKRLNEG
jgi:polo-like kinase 1